MSISPSHRTEYLSEDEIIERYNQLATQTVREQLYLDELRARDLERSTRMMTRLTQWIFALTAVVTLATPVLALSRHYLTEDGATSIHLLHPALSSTKMFRRGGCGSRSVAPGWAIRCAAGRQGEFADIAADHHVIFGAAAVGQIGRGGGCGWRTGGQ